MEIYNFAMTTLGKNIKDRITELDLTQDEVARRAGLSQVALHKIISGKSKTTGKLVEIARVLGVTAEYLLSDKAEANSVQEMNFEPYLVSGTGKNQIYPVNLLRSCRRLV